MKIEVEITEDVLQSAVNKAVLEALERGYSNPVKDAVDEQLKESGGAIKELVKSTIVKAVTNESFKKKMETAVIQKMIDKFLLG